MERTTMKRRATTMGATKSAMSTMPAADFDREIVGDDLVRPGGAWIDQGQRVGALAGDGRQRHKRRSRNRQQLH
jgi:hypothetical protein